MTELLKKFENVNSKELSFSSSYNNEQVFYHSCLIGDIERVQYLLSHNSSSSIDLNRQNSEGLTLLHFACSNNCYALVQLLIEYNADYNLRDHLGRSCLHYASMKGHRAIINLLLRSIDQSNKHDFIYSTDEQEKSSMDYACENDHIDLVELFVQHSDFDQIDLTSPLFYSSLAGHLDICRFLLRKQADRKSLLQFSPSLIKEISDRGHIEILRLLINSIEYLSIVSRPSNVGNSVLFYCIMTFDINLVKQLLERQARLTEKDIHDLISYCPLNDQNSIFVDHYFDCLELIFRFRSNFDDQKICKYFIRELCERCNNLNVGKKLRYLFALSLYNGSIPLNRRSTMKWCGEINIICKRYVNLLDVVKQAKSNWSLKHTLRLKIKRSMKQFNIEQLSKIPMVQQHHIDFLSFEYL